MLSDTVSLLKYIFLLFTAFFGTPWQHTEKVSHDFCITIYKFQLFLRAYQNLLNKLWDAISYILQVLGLPQGLLPAKFLFIYLKSEYVFVDQLKHPNWLHFVWRSSDQPCRLTLQAPNPKSKPKNYKKKTNFSEFIALSFLALLTDHEKRRESSS